MFQVPQKLWKRLLIYIFTTTKNQMAGYFTRQAMILKFQEIRQALCGMNEQERQAEVMIAAENNDLDLLLAVQTAPRILWLVDVDTQQKARQRWLELNKPQEFKTLDTVLGALVIYDHNAHQAIELAGQDAATQRAKTIGQDQPEVVKN